MDQKYLIYALEGLTSKMNNSCMECFDSFLHIFTWPISTWSTRTKGIKSKRIWGMIINSWALHPFSFIYISCFLGKYCKAPLNSLCISCFCPDIPSNCNFPIFFIVTDTSVMNNRFPTKWFVLKRSRGGRNTICPEKKKHIFVCDINDNTLIKTSCI